MGLPVRDEDAGGNNYDYETNYEDDNYGSDNNRNVDDGGNAAPLPISENPQVEYTDDNDYEYEYQDDYDDQDYSNQDHGGASDDVAALPDYEYDDYVDSRSGAGGSSTSQENVEIIGGGGDNA